MTTIKIVIELPEDQAEALAQFCKRATFETFYDRAKNEDEAYLMINGMSKLRESLAGAGYEPR